MGLPSWLSNLTVVEVSLAGTFLLGVVLSIWKTVKFFKPLIEAIQGALREWNGEEAKLDHSGAIIEPAKPGMVVSVRAIKEQLENDHAPINLRHDIDTKASTEDVEKLGTMIEALSNTLVEHINISKVREQQADATFKLILPYLPALKKLAEQSTQETPNGNLQ